MMPATCLRLRSKESDDLLAGPLDLD